MSQDGQSPRPAQALAADPADGRTLAEWGRQVGASDRTLASAFVAGTGLEFGRWRPLLRLRKVAMAALDEVSQRNAELLERQRAFVQNASHELRTHDLARPAPTRLGPLADDALRRWQAVPRRWLRGHRDDPTVLADPDRLAVALDAVLDNAVRFTADADSIELSVRRHGGEAAVTIADSGPGIPENQLESVFDRFDGAAPLRYGQWLRTGT